MTMLMATVVEAQETRWINYETRGGNQRCFCVQLQQRANRNTSWVNVQDNLALQCECVEPDNTKVVLQYDPMWLSQTE